jgi:hypothetical protein
MRTKCFLTSSRQLIPIFDKTAFFTNFPNILTTIRGSEFKEIREKAGLSKMGMSCRRLFLTDLFLSRFGCVETPT